MPRLQFSLSFNKTLKKNANFNLSLQDSRAFLLRHLACHLGNFFCEKDEGRKIPGNYFNNLIDTITELKLV